MLAKIAFRNIFRHRGRTLITLSAIAAGCIAVIFVNGYFEDTYFKMRESYIYSHTGHLQVFRKGYNEFSRTDPYKYLIENPAEVKTIIKNVTGVEVAASRLEFSGVINTGQSSLAFVGQGVEPSIINEIRYKAEAMKDRTAARSGVIALKGDNLSDEKPYTVQLGVGLAQSLGAAIGNNLIIMAGTVAGSINTSDVAVGGIFQTSQKVFDDHVMRLPLPTVQSLLRTESVQNIVITLSNTDDTNRVKADLTALFQQKNLDLEIKTWEEMNDFYAKTKALFGAMFFILKIVLVLIVVLCIVNTMSMSVFERTGEIGTLMALGQRPSRVQALFLWEGFLMGVIGGAIGVVAGSVITYMVARIGIPMPPPPGATMTWTSEPVVLPVSMISGFFLSLFSSVISAYFPARRASKFVIAEALRSA